MNVLVHFYPERFGCGLEKVVISGGAPRTELEVFYAAVLERNEVVVQAVRVQDAGPRKGASLTGMRCRFHQSDIGASTSFRIPLAYRIYTGRGWTVG